MDPLLLGDDVVAVTARASKVTLDSRLLRDYATFYRSSYASVARALTLTLVDVDLATEATDEAMARAYQRWDRISNFESPEGWAYRVGLNWARSVVRRRRRFQVVAMPDDLEGSVAEMGDPALGRALGRLAVDQRAVIVCRFLFDWSVEQTAKALHLRPGTVKSRLHRALAALQTDLSQPEQPS
jgi:RNA polymerase sigma factor (sigma-70 family)